MTLVAATGSAAQPASSNPLPLQSVCHTQGLPTDALASRSAAQPALSTSSVFGLDSDFDAAPSLFCHRPRPFYTMPCLKNEQYRQESKSPFKLQFVCFVFLIAVLPRGIFQKGLFGAQFLGTSPLTKILFAVCIGCAERYMNCHLCLPSAQAF